MPLRQRASTRTTFGTVPEGLLRIMVLGLACLFVLLGLILIPYTGIEFDEALFTTPLYVVRWTGA